MKVCILTVGISGSGKTTWAENFVDEMMLKRERWININRDDIRADIFSEKTGLNDFRWDRWNKKWEKEVRERWIEWINSILDSDIHGVVLSDTNLNFKTREFLINTFERAGFDIQIKLFHCDYETAVKRDLTRINPVGSAVIAEQIEKYWNQFEDQYTPNEDLPKAVIFDIDGTLSHHDFNRGIYEWNKVHLDRPDEFVISIAKGMKSQDYKIVIVSGRDGACKDLSLQWLTDHLGFEPDNFFIRSTKDTRRDSVVKREIFFRNIAPRYNVVGVIDDRPVCVRLWHSLGLKTLAAGLQHKEF